MSIAALLDRTVIRSPLGGAIVYGSVVLLLVLTIVSSMADIVSHRDAVAGASDLLDQLEGRKMASAKFAGDAYIAGANGSPFLEGPTVTVAGAALLQRVAAAVTRFGGNTLSSQVDLQGTQSKAGFITVVASCELDQPGLQQLLYDLETGMPFLFVDQLAVQATTASSAQPSGRMRVLLGVSGKWQGAK